MRDGDARALGPQVSPDAKDAIERRVRNLEVAFLILGWIVMILVAAVARG